MVFDLLANAPTVDTLTAVRIVGDLAFNFASTSEIEGDAIVDIGIGVSSSQAFSTGASALPDPTTETEYPPRGWLYVNTKPMVQSLPTGGTPTAMWLVQPTFTFDLRAMRKIDKGTLFLWMEYLTIGGTVTPRAIGRIRTLCLT